MVAALRCVRPQFQWYQLANATKIKSIQLNDSIVGLSQKIVSFTFTYFTGHSKHHHHLFSKRPSFHVQLGLDVPPEMKPLYISLNTAHLGCKPSTFISFFTHSYQVFLPLPIHLTLPPPHFYRPTPNHPHSYVPHAQTTSIYPASPPQLLFHATFPHSIETNGLH